MIEAICLDDKRKPTLNRPDLWVVEGKKYTIINILRITKSNTLGVELAEIDMTDNDPYLFFDIRRFGFTCTPEELFNFIATCKDLDGLDMNEIVRKITEENLIET